jgi:uncharacterized membrane protein YgcG
MRERSSCSRAGERGVKIEVGYGLEGIIPDGRAGSIIRNVMGRT